MSASRCVPENVPCAGGEKKMMHLKHHLGFPTVSPTFKPVDPEAHMKLTASEFKAGKKKRKRKIVAE